ncbi:addiction module toxin, HicA family [Duganella sp. FT27W]|uniref:type II toxin-antitoxin system HicA family toxin n=2 Tax=unclassified Duganella TaxID=2636909 RepID=UPI0009E7AE29|nr:addiction module toxin, HicA family [Duganella sp. FT27W]
MSKTAKLVARMICIPADFTWDELCTVLAGFSFTEGKAGGGSYRTFTDKHGRKIFLHEPHPGKIMRRYAVREVVSKLKEFGLL